MAATQQAPTEVSQAPTRGGEGPTNLPIQVLTRLTIAAFFFGIGYLGREAADEGKVALGLGLAVGAGLILSWLFGRLVVGIAAAVTRDFVAKPPAAWMYPVDEAVHKVRQFAGLALVAGVAGLVLGALGV